MSRAPFDAEFCIPSWWTEPWPLPAPIVTPAEYAEEQAASARSMTEHGYGGDRAGGFCDEEE